MSEKQENVPPNKRQSQRSNPETDHTSESDSYHTAMGSADEIVKRTSAAKRDEERKKELEEARKALKKAEKEQTRRMRRTASFSPATWKSDGRISAAPSIAGSSRRSTLQGGPSRSMLSYDPSIFGDLPVRYRESKRITEWPESGCIHIPLRDPDTEEYDDEEEEQVSDTLESKSDKQ